MSIAVPNTLKTTVKRAIKKLLRLQAGPVSTPADSSISPFQLNRKTIADYYLEGDGIEIGALHNPLQVPAKARVKYVDRMSVSDLKVQYPELANEPLVEVDIIDDGEKLDRIPSDSQDFVIANHFIEHCQNPIQTLQAIFRVLKTGGLLYMGIPDKRYTFDRNRPITDINHLLKDYHEGPEWSKEQHFFEYAKYCYICYASEEEGIGDPRIEAEAKRMMDMDYSIHFHAWTQTEILELLVTLKKTLNFLFEVELFLKREDEMILILRKGS